MQKRCSLALVFGGTGHVGSHVVRGLARAEVQTVFTYHREHDRARALAAELSQRAYRVDLRDAAAIGRLIADIERDARTPDLFVHCAGIAADLALADVTDEVWQTTQAVNVRSAFVACRELCPRMAARGGGDVVLTVAMAGLQPLPAPVHVAASQAALHGLALALAKELGPQSIRVNLVKLGPLDGGLSGILKADQIEEYERHSAMGRTGTAAEAARAILWVALENTYMTGRVVPVNGGL